jgi:hypothetical protein
MRWVSEFEVESLYEFLERTSQNADDLEAYKADQKAFLEKANLSEEHKEVLLSNDRDRVERALVEEGSPVEETYFVIHPPQ